MSAPGIGPDGSNGLMEALPGSIIAGNIVLAEDTHEGFTRRMMTIKTLFSYYLDLILD